MVGGKRVEAEDKPFAENTKKKNDTAIAHFMIDGKREPIRIIDAWMSIITTRKTPTAGTHPVFRPLDAAERKEAIVVARNGYT